MNRLPAHQNEPHIIERLLAQRQLYAEAKRTHAQAAALTVGGGALLVIIALVWRPFESYAAILGLVLAFTEVLYFERRYDTLRDEASEIRDAVDRELFGDVTRELLAAEGLHEETVAHAAAAARRAGKSEEEVRNWYPVALGALSLPFARLACQRANLAWDERARAWYARIIWLCVAAAATAIMLLALALDLRTESLVLTLLVPLAPGVLWGIREGLRQHDAIKATCELNKRVVDITNAVIQGRMRREEIEQEGRSIQAQLSQWRRIVSPLPEGVYNRHRFQQEHAMRISAETLINSLRSLQETKP